MLSIQAFYLNLPHIVDSLSGCVVVQRSPQNFEVWGADIANHYLISQSALDERGVDIVYLSDASESVIWEHAHQERNDVMG